MKLIYRSIFAAFLTAMFLTNVFADGSAPAWLKQAAAAQIPTYAKDVPGVVLQDSQDITLDGEGRLITTENYAVKILTREGRNLAVAHAFYLVSFSKVRDISGWIIRPDGSVKEYDKKSILDIIADKDDVYNEGRVKLIDASSDVDAGFVFGYSATTEDHPLFYQDDQKFQNNLPVVVSRYTLNLPIGWKASSITFNHDEIKPQISGTNYTWELRNLPYIKPEPMSPSAANTSPRIVVNYAPDNASQAVNRTFADWTAVSRWGSNLHDPQVVVDDAIAAKARELTATSKTELEKIRAVGSFVQNLQYISVDIGVGYGNGYRPRTSALVLSRGYGDCKDKANLMRAMLKALKIESYPIAIYSGDPNYVREEWASPEQFNHCIIAVKVGDETIVPTILNHPKLGRLLIFDATDPYTAVGDLPDYEQGSFALIMAGDNGGLSKMPVTPSEFNGWQRTTEVSLADDGSIKGLIHEQVSGQNSTYARAMFRSLSGGDFNKAIEGWLTRGAIGAQLVKLTPTDKQADAGFNMDIEFSAPRYAQLMQNRLLVFKPAIVNRSNSIYLTEKTRSAPVMLDANSFRETAVFNLPSGFVVDEMPDAVTLETSFGKYSTKYEAKDGKLIFTRSLTTNRAIVPVDKYGSVKDFYSKIMAAEQAPVVLLRK
ncbi:MAG: DUF3857 domain-containing transglutaminase family protein [Acidobacteriota bacterium]|nr:DUF3857 domain-containing transglutaminase family protein [Acidobacteriota bacterium]